MSDLSAGILGLATSAAPDSSAAPPADAPEVDTVETDTTDVAEVPPDGAIEATDTGEAPAEGDKSAAPPNASQIRAALKAFREASPEHAQAAKLLNDGYSRAEAYKEVFPDVATARNVRAALDTIGGIEGLSELQSTIASVEETDSLLDAGDPKVLDQIIEDSPEGFKKIAPHVLSRLQKLDADTFQKTLQPHLVRSLIDANFPATLQYLERAVGDNADAKAVVQNIMQWFEGQKSVAERLNNDTLNPEREKLNTERQQLVKERQDELKGRIAQDTDSHIRQELGTKLRPFSESLKTLPEAVRADVARACITHLAQALRADKAFQTQLQTMLNSKKPDRERIVRFTNEKVSSLGDKIIETVVKSYGLKTGKPAARTTTTTKAVTESPAANSAMVKLARQPNINDIDWETPGAQQGFIAGRALMKSGQFKGRYVQWKKA